jgi:N-acetylglucosaminyldiphosphoundecaprenol N-acetyl-beta-D-mannosaminyltransferase
MGSPEHSHSSHPGVSVARQIARRWPIVLLVTLVAVAEGVLALNRREPSYESTARLLITPLPQYDVSFLGTSLIRDSGDASRTPATVAEAIDSHAAAAATARRLGGKWTVSSVQDAVDVETVIDANVLHVKVRAGTAEGAERLARTFVQSALARRWHTIRQELTRRIAAFRQLAETTQDTAALHRERLLESIRSGGIDPTLKLQGVDSAVSTYSLPGAVIVLLSLLGGLLLGALAALGVARFSSALLSEKDVRDVFPLPILARVPPHNSSSEGFDRVAVQIENRAPEGGTIAVTSPSTGVGLTTVAKGIAKALTKGGRKANIARPGRDSSATDKAPGSVRQVLADAQGDADFIVVAGPPLDADASALMAATLADVALLVVRLGSNERRELTRARDLLEETGVQPAGLILIEATDRHDSVNGRGPAKRRRRFRPIPFSRSEETLGGTRPEGSRQVLMGMPLDGLTLTKAVERVFKGLETGRGGAVFTPNLEILRQYRRSPNLHRVFDATELLVPDGTPLVWASRLQGTPVPQRVTGSDMLAGVTSAAAARGASVFFAGGHPGVAQRAADRLADLNPDLRAAAHPCFIDPGLPLAPQVEDLADAIVADAPDIVYVGLPFAGQVHLVTALRPRLPRTWFVGVGSCFDLVNGDRPRAPEWLQRIGLEWAHRIVHEPRVWRRYLISGLPFAAHLSIHALTVRMDRRPSTQA